MTYLFAALSMIFFLLWINERRKRDDCEFLLELEKNWKIRYHDMKQVYDENSAAKDKLINTSNDVIRVCQELNKEKDIYIENLTKTFNQMKDVHIKLLNKK